MKKDYSYSVNNWFKDFPRVFKMTCGPNIVELEGPWVEDTQLILTQTPLSKTHQGSYVITSPLPDYQMIYTDTGSDTDFTIKYIEYGWGTFIILPDESNYFLKIEKYCELFSGYNGKCVLFQNIETIPTTLETNLNLAGVSSPSPSATPSAPITDPDTGLYVPRWDLKPDQIDLSYYFPTIVRDYGTWCDPIVEFSYDIHPIASFYEVGMQSIFYEWLADPNAPAYNQNQLINSWYTSFIRAPERAGIYIIVYRFDWVVVGWNGIIPIYEMEFYIDYVFFVHSVIYDGEEIIPALRDALLRERGEIV